MIVLLDEVSGRVIAELTREQVDALLTNSPAAREQEMEEEIIRLKSLIVEKDNLIRRQDEGLQQLKTVNLEISSDKQAAIDDAVKHVISTKSSKED